MTSTHPTKTIEIVPSGQALGAEIRGCDLRDEITPDVADQIRRALLDDLVLVFRNQQISEEDQVRFTRVFGTPVEHVRAQLDRPVREIFIISNIQANGQPMGALGNDEIAFHSDLSYMREPGTISILYAVEVPARGGNTQWVNCYEAYEALDESIREKLRGRRAIHRHPEEKQNPVEPVAQPVVRTHPETQRKSLYVSPHFVKRIEGMEPAESDELLKMLFEHIQQPRFIYTHRWQVGDLLVWDNRPTMHRREPFPATERRLMRRTQIFNSEVPYE